MRGLTVELLLELGKGLNKLAHWLAKTSRISRFFVVLAIGFFFILSKYSFFLTMGLLLILGAVFDAFEALERKKQKEIEEEEL